MGIPEDAIAVVKDLYEGASIVVQTPKGNTTPIPIAGRGTIQGDTLSPLLFIIYAEPLLRWLARGDAAYKLKTSDTRVGPLAYADDLAVVTESPTEASAQLRKIESYCEWAGIKVNIDPVNKNKTVFTRAVRTGRAGADGCSEEVAIQGQHIPVVPSEHSYRYLGVWINLNLDWGDQWAAVVNKVREEKRLINGCVGSAAQQRKLVEQVMRPAIRYSMTVVPYTWPQIQRLHSILMNCTRTACGLSEHASTLLMMRAQTDYGVGVESVYHTYIYTAAESVREILSVQDDRGRMARGLWDAHVRTRPLCNPNSVRESAIAGLPTLHTQLHLAQLGIGTTCGTTAADTRRAAMHQSDEGPTLSPPALADPACMTPFWEIGLYDLSDFTTLRGDRVMPYTDFARKYRWSRVLDKRHPKALLRLCTRLSCGPDFGYYHYVLI